MMSEKDVMIEKLRRINVKLNNKVYDLNKSN